MSPSLRQLQAFVESDAAGSLSRAAQAMDITPSATSLLVRQLEQQLGLTLFDRGVRGLRLTEAGRSMLPLARRALLACAQMQDLAQQRRQSLHGRLRLAATPAMARHLLPPVIRKFGARYPDIRLELDDGHTGRLSEVVAEERADLALATVEGALAGGVEAERLLRDPLCLVCHRDDALARLETVAWTALEGGPTVLVGPGGGVRELIDRALREQGVSVRTDFEVHQLGTAISLVEHGLGRTVVPSFLLSFGQPETVVVRPLEPAYTRDVSMLWRRTAMPDATVQAFAALLRLELGD